MLKYVALMKVEDPVALAQLDIKYFNSPITDKQSAEKWLTDKLKEYPDASLNTYSGIFTTIYTTILAFDDQESKNVELFLKNF